MKTLLAASPGEIAIKVCEVLNARPGHERYRQLPYNRFDGYLDHLVWLVPGPERVVFSHSKFFFNWWDEDRGEVWVGLHIEKGFGEQAAEKPSDKSVMTRDWAWHKVFPFLGMSTMTASLASVNEFMGETGAVRISITPSVEGIESDRIQEATYSLCGGSELRLLESQECAPEWPIKGCTTLAAIREVIERREDADWFWIDLFLGFRAHIKPTKGADRIAQAHELALKVCAPLEQWVQ